MNSVIAHQPQRLVILDYLRGLAALSVVVFHLFYKGPTEGWMKVQPLPIVSDIAGYGYLGVNLFFLISGFVIALSVEGTTFRRFATARLTRLLPASTICATLTTLLLVFVEGPSKVLISNWLATLTLVPAWFGQPGVDAVYWSLRIEVQFYLAVALLLLLQKKDKAPVVIALWLLFSLVNLFLPIWRLDFLLCLSWAPYLCAGVLFHAWHARVVNLKIAVGLVACLFLALSYAFNSAVKDGYEIPSVTCFIVFLMFIIFAGFCVKKMAPESTKASQFFGSTTYPLYLFHQVIGYAIFNFLFTKISFSVAKYILPLLILFGLMATAHLIHLALEKPLATWLRVYLCGLQAKPQRPL